MIHSEDKYPERDTVSIQKHWKVWIALSISFRMMAKVGGILTKDYDRKVTDMAEKYTKKILSSKNKHKGLIKILIKRGLSDPNAASISSNLLGGEIAEIPRSLSFLLYSLAKHTDKKKLAEKIHHALSNEL
ncbi:DgyrCDS13408 [Dimorphilus gyrociliatus]|uniref:DgyrCDS13408 n=1 Tax=Dimorphilus gyrociliatus TaxID=2664684 RepID=A0A7I8WAK9_9ANNE|nr:DgyrCDS13408 [Dimorphilus gyrociliatus]